MSDISTHFEKAKAKLQSERDSMAQTVKEQVSQSKRKALAKA